MPDSKQGLRSPLRSGSLDAKQTSGGLFPFDAFSWDNYATVKNPKLYLNSPWKLEVQNLTVTSKLAVTSLVVSSYASIPGGYATTLSALTVTGILQVQGSEKIGNVDLSSASVDYDLGVGETAVINFTSATSVPLHIATGDGMQYKMSVKILGTVGGAVPSSSFFLNPNNTTYAGAFRYPQIVQAPSALAGYYSTSSAFYLGDNYGVADVIICNNTIMKVITGSIISLLASSDFMHKSFGCGWRDSTTVWSSIGTLAASYNMSGYVLIERIA